MRLSLLALASGLALLSGLPAHAQQVPGLQASQADQPIVIGVSHALTSVHLGDVRQINVWTPAAHGTGARRYRVLYVLDGAIGQDFQHVAGLAQLGDLSWTFEPLIVVGIETRDRRSELTPAAFDGRFTDAFPDSGRAEAFRRFVADEVIPFVETRYRTSGKRALAGESLAGLFVVDTLLKTPELFDDYLAVSPSLWWDDQRLARDAGTHLQNPNMQGRRLWLAMADEGGTMQDGVDRLRLAIADSRRGPEVEYLYLGDTETHATIYHRALLAGLRSFYGGPEDSVASPPWYMMRDSAGARSSN